MKKALSILLVLVMLLVAVPVSVYAAADDTEKWENEFLKGLSDPAFTKKTEKYDGYHFKVGTKATWTCTLYTLTATVTKVKGNKATFSVKFKNNIPKEYRHDDMPQCHKYEIMLYANSSWKTFNDGDTMKYTVNTAVSDGLDTSGITGMQFFKIAVRKSERYSIDVPSTNKYYKGIAKNREVEYGSGAHIVGFELEDVYTLGYYTSPDFVIYQNNYVVKKDSITLGTYPFESIVQYKVKGAKSWKEKTFKKNKKMSLTGLKADTTYQIHVLCKIYFTDPETKKKQYTVDQVTGIFDLTTIIKSKPPVTSIKVSKYKDGKKKTINGYWESDGDWHPTETFNTATYTVTVKVKSVPKNAKGLVLKVGGATYYAKGNKKSYTFKLSYQDTKKINGKKMKASFSWSSNNIGKSYLGLSPAKTATYKIKNGTY